MKKPALYFILLLTCLCYRSHAGNILSAGFNPKNAFLSTFATPCKDKAVAPFEYGDVLCTGVDAGAVDESDDYHYSTPVNCNDTMCAFVQPACSTLTSRQRICPGQLLTRFLLTFIIRV